MLTLLQDKNFEAEEKTENVLKKYLNNYLMCSKCILFYLKII